MVDAVVSFTVKRLGALVIEQVNFLRGVRSEVNFLRDKLEYMLDFLEDAEEKKDDDSRIYKWVIDIRDAAYDAEDIIDKFILKVKEGRNPKKRWIKVDLGKYFGIYKQAKLYGIGKEIKALEKTLNEITVNQAVFNIEKIGAAREVSRTNKKLKNLRSTREYNEEVELVGFNELIKLLMSQLLEEVPDQLVISIVGMAGSGKTTIAQKLRSTVNGKFDHYAWVFVSNHYDIKDLLKKTIKSFRRPTTAEEFKMLEMMDQKDLEVHLRELLKDSRYLVVIDDVWHTVAWESLRKALPENNKNSRVIITTRNRVVAKSCSRDTKYVHELPFLEKEESWELFCKKAIHKNDGPWPPHIKKLAGDLASKCYDLPLAIDLLGGLLYRKENFDEWPNQQDNIWRYVNDDDIRRRGSALIPQILASSLNDLPPHLKSCFLYLGLFPKDIEIDAEKLLRLWVAEGFIHHEGGKTLEKIAADCLNELIERNLIQIAERKWRRIRRCRVHDVLRDFAIEKSKELGFLHIYDGNDDSTLSDSKHRRRLASQSGGLKRLDFFEHSANLKLRTLLFFNLEKESTEIEELQSLCTNLKLMRVLDLKDIKFNPSQEIRRVPDAMWKLIHLRYLGLSGTNINEIPPSIGNLQALQTLECSQDCDSIRIPDEICNAKQLRHLIGRFKWPSRVKNLTNLITLKHIEVDDKMEFNSIKDLSSLRELYVIFRGEGNGFTLDCIGKLKYLQTLYLEQREGTGLFDMLQPLSHCKKLLQLKLIGEIRKLPTEMHKFLPNLKYLYLDGNKMEEDPMPSLGKLSKLTILHLHNYIRTLACTAGGFPQLENLQLSGGNVQLQVDEGGMPSLQGLYIPLRVRTPERLRSVHRFRTDLGLFIDKDDWPYYHEA